MDIIIGQAITLVFLIELDYQVIYLDKYSIRITFRKNKNEYTFDNLNQETYKILTQLEKWFNDEYFVFYIENKIFTCVE